MDLYCVLLVTSCRCYTGNKDNYVLLLLLGGVFYALVLKTSRNYLAGPCPVRSLCSGISFYN